MNKKYILLDSRVYTIECHRNLYQLQAIRDFGDIKAGDLGGYIEKESNLSHDGNCWVYDYAKVFDNARVTSDAFVSEDAVVCGNAGLFGNAQVSGDAQVYGNARVINNAQVMGNVHVSGNARVCGDIKIDKAENIMVIGPIGSRHDFTTFIKSNDEVIYVTCGCFFGTINEFEKKVLETHDKDSIHRKQYINVIGCVKNILMI